MDKKSSFFMECLPVRRVSDVGREEGDLQIPGTPLMRCLYVFFFFFPSLPSSSSGSRCVPGVAADAMVGVPGSRSLPLPLSGEDATAGVVGGWVVLESWS